MNDNTEPPTSPAEVWTDSIVDRLAARLDLSQVIIVHTDGSDELRGTEEISKFLRISTSHVGKGLKDGVIPGQQVGSRWLASRAALTRWLAGSA